MRYHHGLLLGLGALALAACKTTTSLAGDAAGSAGSGGQGGAAGTTSSSAGAAGDAGTAGTGGTGGGGPKARRVDLLFTIDNSRSMADKQEILSLALDDLITGLTDPPCLDDGGNVVAQPGGLSPCPAGSHRQFEPLFDIHVGIVSSSLGGHGSDACSTAGAGKQSNDDRGHLLSRTDPVSGASVPTYKDLGFLAWDPTQMLDPPGESNSAAMVQSFKDMVLGVGQIGCGYEAQLESWYRFLVDPEPPETVTLDAMGAVSLQGTDDILLAQRKAFLRPDSMLVIVMLTDENDCSIREEGQYYFAAQQKGGNGNPFHMPRSRSICASDPSNECCFSCAQQGPTDPQGNPLCADDPLCKDANGQLATLDEQTDNINERCFDQKRRFGIDFLYPTDRYVSALSGAMVTNRAGDVVPNPLFSDLDPTDDITAIRDTGLVLFAGIVGVPWQDIAKNPNDLKQGFKTSGELTQKNVNGQTTWDIILGDPSTYTAPLDPFMRESIFPRSGQNPVTGDATTLPAFENPINGHEFTNMLQDDLQYCCIMPILAPRNCATGGLPSCDCENPVNDNPLCTSNPDDGGKPTLQVKAKGTPGLRQLSVLRGIGDRAVIGSICAAQVTDNSLPDYGYRPVMSSILDRMKSRLQ